jgi:hypothetical protein
MSTPKKDYTWDYNKLEIAFAKELWPLIEKYKLVDNEDDRFTNDSDTREDEIYLLMCEVFDMKKNGYLDKENNNVSTQD